MESDWSGYLDVLLHGGRGVDEDVAPHFNRGLVVRSYARRVHGHISAECRRGP
jgi:hypothetical protein